MWDVEHPAEIVCSWNIVLHQRCFMGCLAAASTRRFRPADGLANAGVMINPDMSVWTGRDDTPTEGPNALRWWQCVKPYMPDAAPGIVLIGFACDEGVRRNGGRVGAKDGPRHCGSALANMAWHQRVLVYDAGDDFVFGRRSGNCSAE